MQNPKEPSGGASEPSRRATANRERGAAAVELAVLTPFLLLLLFAFIDFGMAFYTKAALSAGVREGARIYARNGDPDQAGPAVRNATMGGQVLPTDAQIFVSTCNDNGNCSANTPLSSAGGLSTCPKNATYFTMSVSYPWNGIAGGLVGRFSSMLTRSPGPASPIMISASTRMHCLG